MKLKAQEKLAKHISFLESYEREKNVILDKMNCFEARTKSLDETIETQLLQYKELQQRGFERIEKNIFQTLEDIEKCQNDRNKLESEINHLKAKEKELVIEIQELGEVVEVMKESTKEDQKEQRQKEAFERLQSCYSGVVSIVNKNEIIELFSAIVYYMNNWIFQLGRLFCLCEIIWDNKVITDDIAITKIMGKNMDFIVVDTKHTAKNCIAFLKEQYAGSKYSVTEYFWPLDSVKPISLDVARQ